MSEMQRMIFEHRAEPGERFAPDAFRRVIGTATTLRAPGYEGPAKVTDAEVINDGQAVRVSIEYGPQS